MQGYMAFFVVIIFYIIGFVWKRKTWVKIRDIDVDSGRREIEWSMFEAERVKRQSWPAWRRFVDKFI